MKRTAFFLPAALAAVGCILGLWQRAAGRNELGFWDTGSVPVIGLVLLSVLAVIVFILLARKTPKVPQTIPGGLSAGLGTVLGGVLLAVTVLADFTAYPTLALLCGVLGIIAAVITVLQGLQRIRGKQPELLLGCVIVLWLVLRIIGDFKSWSTDPMILDYCYPLLALLCSMAAGFHTAGWLAGLGRGRITAFWCMAGLFFCAAALPEDLLLFGGLLLLNAQNLWCMAKAQ